MNPLRQRFADPETELAFLRAERTARGQPIRALIVIAVVTLISYIVINPMHLPTEGVRAYTLAAVFLIAAPSRFCVFWIRNTIRKVTIVEPVVMISCQVSEKPNSGPVTAHTTTTVQQTTKASGVPVA